MFDEITGGADRIELGNVSVNARAYVARFNFRSSQQQKKVGECSGGERNRIHLAKMLRRGGNLLLLDEPTNDLDVATMRVLEQAMIDFSGCALVISHDRFFLDRICTHLLVMEGDGRVTLVRGQFRRLRGGRAGREPRPLRPPPRQVSAAHRQAAAVRGGLHTTQDRVSNRLGPRQAVGALAGGAPSAIRTQRGPEGAEPESPGQRPGNRLPPDTIPGPTGRDRPESSPCLNRYRTY